MLPLQKEHPLSGEVMHVAEAGMGPAPTSNGRGLKGERDKAEDQDKVWCPCHEEERPPGSTFKDLPISGVSRVLGNDRSKALRVVWAVVLLTCTGLMLHQVIDRILYFASTPVSVNVRVTRNHSLKFPDISFCNKNQFNMTAVRSLQDQLALQRGETNLSVIRSWKLPMLLEVHGMDVDHLWNITRHRLGQLIKECWFGRGIHCDKVGQWRTVFTVLGVCYKYSKEGSVTSSGSFNNLYMTLHDLEPELYFGGESGFKILIHDPRDEPVIDLRTHGTTVEQGWGKDVRVAVREFTTIPTSRRPCIETSSYSSSQCIAGCFLRALYNITGCRMPYMPDIEGRHCDTPDEYSKSVASEKYLLFDGGWSSTDCNCMKQCNEDIYTMFTEAAQASNISAKIRVFFQDLTFDEVSEEIAYGVVALLCDIGGTLGLLLGASVLTFFEIIEIACYKLISPWRHLTAAVDTQ